METHFETQINIMEKTWGRGRSGYVFFPWIPGKCADVAERRQSYNEGPAFFWPDDREKIKRHLEKHANDDVYWCPSLFDKNRRLEPYAAPEKALWADLDEVHPEEVPQEYRPTVAWETSPGRYQGIWLLTHELVGASWAGKENHRLTAFLGADPSGWDTTQLMRIPGWPNHKPDHRHENGGKPPPGKLIWKTGPYYTVDQFKDLPEVQTLAVDESVMDEEIDAVDRHSVWGKVRLRVSKAVREFMTAKEPSGDRSEVLWQIERELADAGCTLSEIVAIVRGSVWNKYSGRNDELKRLRIEAAKAIQAREDSDTLEEVHEAKPATLPTIQHLITTITRPTWMVDGIWRQGVCGFIAGDPKSYKSWVALDLALSIASGHPFLGVFRIKRSGPVIFIEEEDQANELAVRHKAVAAGRDPTLDPHGALYTQGQQLFWHPTQNIPLYYSVGEGFIASDEGWQEWLADKIRELNARMVVIDTFGTTAGGVDIDRGGEVMTRALMPLKTLAHDHECSLAIVHHNRKSSEGANGGRRMLGSHHLHGWTEDSLFFLPPDKGTVTIERDSKAARLDNITLEVPRMYNLEQGGATWSPVVEIGKEVKKDSGKSKEEPVPPVVAKMVAAGVVPGHSMSTKAIAEVTGLSRSGAYNQLKRAAEKKEVVPGQVNGHQVWALKDG